MLFMRFSINSRSATADQPASFTMNAVPCKTLLDILEQRQIPAYRLHLDLLDDRARGEDQCDFAVYLIDAAGFRLSTPIFRGRYHTGCPFGSVPGWIDGDFLDPLDEPHLEGRVERIRRAVAQALGLLLPPGGRFWIAYEAFDHDGALQRETRAALFARVPLPATPIGRLLVEADCWVGLRDWYVPEGGREGPRKLQGNKPQDARHARRRADDLIRELSEFLQRPSDDDEIVRRARARARGVLAKLRRRREQSERSDDYADAH